MPTGHIAGISYACDLHRQPVRVAGRSRSRNSSPVMNPFIGPMLSKEA